MLKSGSLDGEGVSDDLGGSSEMPSLYEREVRGSKSKKRRDDRSRGWRDSLRRGRGHQPRSAGGL